MLIYPPHILTYFWVDRFEYEVVDRIQRIGEDKLGPSKDPKFVTGRVEVISSSKFIRRLIDTSSPDAELKLQLMMMQMNG